MQAGTSARVEVANLMHLEANDTARLILIRGQSAIKLHFPTLDDRSPQRMQEHEPSRAFSAHILKICSPPVATFR
jgi:hypothetical protein